jgi:SAM-dependent methyltransferase
VKLTPTNLQRQIRLFYRSLRLLPHYQRIIGPLRLFWFVKVRRNIRLLNSDQAFAVTVDHNLKSLHHFNQRTDALLRPLSVIETMGAESKVLIVGPRNEGDLFSAIGYGFEPKNVRGLDLISYSPMVDLGDMHHTPYAGDTFDAVVVGWTLSYSSDPKAFAAEMVRILRDGGLIAIGVEYSEMTEEETIAYAGYRIQETDKLPDRINSTKAILDLFEGYVADIYFNHDAPAKRSHTSAGMVENVSRVLVIFSIRKPLQSE